MTIMFKAQAWDMESEDALSEAGSPFTTGELPLRLRGRYMLADRSEHECETRAVSVDEIEFKVGRRGEIGERVIAYLDELGRIEGVVTVLEPDHFRLAPKFSPGKRERMRRKFAWLHERQEGRAAEGRVHERIEPDTPARIEIVALGDRREAKVIDYSRSGVALQTDVPLNIGDPLWIGGVKARIVRSGPDFLAAQFDELQEDEIAALRERAA